MSGWRGATEIGVGAQSGDDADITSHGSEEIDGGERGLPAQKRLDGTNMVRNGSPMIRQTQGMWTSH